MEEKHSGIGIASFIISLVMAVAIFITAVVAGVVEVSTPGGMDEKSVVATLVGLFVLTFVFIDLAAFGLGIAGLFQRERKKVFSILGTVISIVTVIGTIVLIVSGLNS